MLKSWECCAVILYLALINASLSPFRPNLDEEIVAAHLKDMPVSADAILSAEAFIAMRVVDITTIKLGFFLEAPRSFSL